MSSHHDFLSACPLCGETVDPSNRYLIYDGKPAHWSCWEPMLTHTLPTLPPSPPRSLREHP